MCYAVASKSQARLQLLEALQTRGALRSEQKEQAIMLVYIDPQTGEFLWRCPLCGESIRCQDQFEIDQLESEAACEGCRARELFESNPEIIAFAVDMWARMDSWPQSSTWMEAIPPSGISVLGGDYHAEGLRYPRRTAVLSWTAG